MTNIPLGQSTKYPSAYDAGLLFPVAREDKRKEIGVSDPAPFYGADYWTAYELSWLNSRGKPKVAIAEFEFDRNTPNIIESKSFKLYLNSFNQERFADLNELQNVLLKDLRAVCGSEDLDVRLYSIDEYTAKGLIQPNGRLLDELDIECQTYEYTPSLIQLNAGSNALVTESLYTHLLKSNCLITSQPDWATLFIDYHGVSIDHSSLLQYIVSFRSHDEFHEQCVERIFQDIMTRCHPEKLSVYARYTRRGGLDINPWRSTESQTQPPFLRLARQ